MKNQLKMSDYGIKIGQLKSGPLNKITDVKGVKVGHATVDTNDYKTGVTMICPSEEDIFRNKLVASSYILNGYGKTVGLIQLNELGQLESPIALTNTLNVGKVQDSLIGYMLNKAALNDVEIRSLNTIVAECNDSYLNKISDRAVCENHVLQAIESAVEDFKEGDIGGGKGMSCHQLKGGIGSASRVFGLENKEYTVGVLVQSNYGLLEDLCIDGNKLGKLIDKKLKLKKEEDKGSIIIVVATDLPVSSRQLGRICKRASVGLARLGSYMGHGSGEIVIGFSTANTIKYETESRCIQDFKIMREENLDLAFRAVAEATEEAVLNSMITANEVEGYKGNKRESLKSYINLLD